MASFRVSVLIVWWLDPYAVNFPTFLFIFLLGNGQALERENRYLDYFGEKNIKAWRAMPLGYSFHVGL